MDYQDFINLIGIHREFIIELIDEHCIVKKKYIREDIIYQDILDKLLESFNHPFIDYDSNQEIAREIQEILIALKDNYVDQGDGRGFDPRSMDMDLAIFELIQQHSTNLTTIWIQKISNLPKLIVKRIIKYIKLDDDF